MTGTRHETYAPPSGDTCLSKVHGPISTRPKSLCEDLDTQLAGKFQGLGSIHYTVFELCVVDLVKYLFVSWSSRNPRGDQIVAGH